MQKPTVGRMVHVLVDAGTNNGADTASAVITRVWDDGTVNLHVFLDSPYTAWYSSVPLFAERPTLAESMQHPAFMVMNPTIAWWPPRS